MSETGRLPSPDRGEAAAGAAVESTLGAVGSAARAVDHAVPKVDDASDAQLGRTARVLAWTGPLFVLLAVVMVPWTAYLAVKLPRQATAAHYDVSWVGFDVGLIAALCWTAWCALRRSNGLAIAATVNATLLVVDAWFDVVTAPTSRELVVSVAMAAFVELPLAVACLWLARGGQLMLEQRVRLRVERLRGRRGH